MSLIYDTWFIIRPEATTNLVTNPSFETNTTGWATGGTNSLACSDDQQWAGNYSLEVTYGNNSVLARHAVSLATSTTYRLTARLYVPDNWDGGNIALDINGLASATLTTISQWTAGTDPAGEWVLLEAQLVIAADGAGNIDLSAGGSPTAGRKVYLDAVQVEAKTDYHTTYCDGDQPGCTWTDKAHGSTSTRSALSRAGGRALSLVDLGLEIEEHGGAGMPPVVNITSERSLLPGAEYQRHTVAPRTLLLTLSAIGSDLAAYHAQRQTLVRLLAPDSVPDDQPVILEYRGAAEPKRLAMRYDAGLELRGPGGRTRTGESLAVRLLATEPFWEGVGETAVSLGPTSATMRLIVARIGGDWTVFGPPHASGTYTAITAIAVASPNEVYVAGKFANFDNDPSADSIVMWDGDSWEPVGSPQLLSNNDVLALALDPAGILYVAGTFENIGAVADADYIASWDGSNYAALGTPSSGATITGIYAVAVDPLTGNIWVAGDFENLAGVAGADYIAYFDISTDTWTAPGASGANGVVYSLAFAPDGTLYAGGAFTSIAGVSANRIARRNPAGGWSVMGSGFSSDATLTIAVTPAGAIYAGGEWASHGYVSQWKQGGWRTVAGGTDGDVRKLLPMPDGSLVALGAFTEAGGNSLADGLAVLAEGAWGPLSIDLPGSVAEGTLANWGDDLYVGTDQSGTAYFAAGATAVTNSGTARAYPIIEVANEGTATPVIESITNVTTGRRLLFRPGYVVLPGDRLRLDLRPGRVKATDKNGAAVPWPLAPGSDVAEFYLLPGTNELAAYSSPSAPVDLKILLRFRPAYWSID